jgi:hypothetical protein
MQKEIDIDKNNDCTNFEIILDDKSKYIIFLIIFYIIFIK